MDQGKQYGQANMNLPHDVVPLPSQGLFYSNKKKSLNKRILQPAYHPPTHHHPHDVHHHHHGDERAAQKTPCRSRQDLLPDGSPGIRSPCLCNHPAQGGGARRGRDLAELSLGFTGPGYPALPRKHPHLRQVV